MVPHSLPAEELDPCFWWKALGTPALGEHRLAHLERAGPHNYSRSCSQQTLACCRNGKIPCVAVTSGHVPTKTTFAWQEILCHSTAPGSVCSGLTWELVVMH